MRDGTWRSIASTVKTGAADCDADEMLGLSSSERAFAREMLFDDIESPLVVMRENGDECQPIIIVRNTIFEASMCVAVETDDSCIDLICHDGEFVLSPKAASFAKSHRKTADGFDPNRYASVYDLAEFISRLNFPSDGGIGDVRVFDGLVQCAQRVLEIEVEIEHIEAGILTANANGRIFLGGFCMCCMLAMAISARMYSCDGRLKMSATCNSGHMMLKLSYINNKRKLWGEADRLAEIADAYGVALAIRVENGETGCFMIPERVDEAVSGVKEGLISSFGWF